MSRVKWFVRSFGRGGLLTALFIAATLLSVSAASAGPGYWDCYNANSAFSWSNATGNWAKNGVSTTTFPNFVSGYAQYVAIDHGATVTLDGSYTASSLIVGGYSSFSYVALGGVGTLNLTTPGTTLTVPSSVSVASNGFGGTVNQSAGATLTSGGDFWLGGTAGGATNTAYWHQTGGTASFMNMYLGGKADGAYGKYVQDDGLLKITGGLSGMTFGQSTGGPGGEYHLNGGTLNLDVDKLKYFYSGTTTGSFEFAGGTMLVGRDTVSSGFDASHPMSLKASTNSTVDPNGHTIQFQNGLTGSGAINVGGATGGVVKFSGNNDYTGATKVVGGTLYVTAGSISTSSDIQVATGATYKVLVSPSTSVSLYSRLTSGDSNALQLKGSVLAADSTLDSTDVAMQWRPRTSPEVGLGLASDILTLTSVAAGPTQAYVLGMDYSSAAAPAGAVLGYYNGAAWANAVSANTGNNATGGELGYVGTFSAFQGAYGSTLDSYIGAYGYDPVGHQAWAVLDHSSDFGVTAVPEPATLILLATGLLGMLAYAWRKRK
jgi:autotransporter-associated beta strand protein